MLSAGLKEILSLTWLSEELFPVYPLPLTMSCLRGCLKYFKKCCGVSEMVAYWVLTEKTLLA